MLRTALRKELQHGVPNRRFLNFVARNGKVECGQADLGVVGDCPRPPATMMPASNDSNLCIRSGELISNPKPADPSKETYFKKRFETVSPVESTELQRTGALENGFNEPAAFQGAEVGLRMLQFLASYRGKIAPESR
jgi:hypothetical protein